VVENQKRAERANQPQKQFIKSLNSVFIHLTIYKWARVREKQVASEMSGAELCRAQPRPSVDERPIWCPLMAHIEL